MDDGLLYVCNRTRSGSRLPVNVAHGFTDGGAAGEQQLGATAGSRQTARRVRGTSCGQLKRRSRGKLRSDGGCPHGVSGSCIPPPGARLRQACHL